MSTKNTGCAWFMVPPSVWQQILHGIENIGHPSFEIAVATYACGDRAKTLRSQGYQGYATKAEAENAVNQANRSANQPPSALSGVTDFLGRLGQANTWIRGAEIVLGIILIGVGIARLTGAQNLASQIVKARIP